jgi:hypothetical protein
MVYILKQVGAADWDRERLNMSVNTPASCSEDAARDAIWAGSPARVNTLTMDKEIPQSLGAVCVGGTVLSSKRGKNVFSLSGSKT